MLRTGLLEDSTLKYKIILLVLGLFVSGINFAYSATYVAHNEFYKIHVPGDAYIPSGTISESQYYTFGLGMTQSWYVLEVTITAPDSLEGGLEFVTSSKPYGSGWLFYDGTLFGGESSSFTMSGSLLSTPEVPTNVYLSMALYGTDQVITFGEGGSFITAGVDTSVIPIPAAFWLFGSALLSFVGFSRRRTVFV